VSAGDERASRRVEVLAIVVGGVVGLAGILVTLQSSRLGGGAHGPTQYRNSIRAYRCAGIALTYRHPGNRCPPKPASEFFDTGNRNLRTFIKQARELARSQLPPDSP
jgi:hypothetical protein